MRVALVDYMGKGMPLSGLLVQAGHRLVEKVQNADALFVDIDVPWAPDRVKLIEQAASHGSQVFQYPHGGNPHYCYDGLCEPHPSVTAMLVTGPGHVEFHERLGHARPVRDIGWFLCPTVPFRRPPSVRNVLFAPAHPWADGFSMTPGDFEANQQAFDAVLSLGVPVTVRFVGDAKSQGLWRVPGVTYLKAQPVPAIHDIERHDLVVATETFASLALARGKPVVMFRQDAVPATDDGMEFVKSWDSYKDLVRYPLNVGGTPMRELAERACDGEGLAWASAFVGVQSTPERLAGVLDEFAAVRA